MPPAAGPQARNRRDNARKVAAVLQRVRPDLVLLNEFDYDAGHHAADLFQQRYLETPQPLGGAAALSVPVPSPGQHRRAERSDLDGDGRGDGPGDAWGFGRHPGQYGMLVLSRYPIDAALVRSSGSCRGARCRTRGVRSIPPPAGHGTRMRRGGSCGCRPNRTGTCPC
jgi:endonuclease/exonuclease/phosphatase family metal-dependent hydrolase